MRREEHGIASALKTLLPSDEQMEQACERVSQRLRSNRLEEDTHTDELFQYATRFPMWRMIAASAVVLALLLIFVGIWRRTRSETLVERTSAATFENGRVIQSKNTGKVLELSDGSWIEMRADSELIVESTRDGVRVGLHSGSVVIQAAKQSIGHLYVQTKDMMVSVTGTVFFVSAEEAGSRVAVIEGTVQVEQGSLSSKLTAGQQFSTNPAMPSIAIEEQISWSRSALAYLRLLPQLSEPARATQRSDATHLENAPNTGTVFEVASIRPGDPSRGGGRGAGPQACGGDIQVEPRRFLASNVTLYRLIAVAYGKDCIFMEQNGDLLVGVPEWTRSDAFVIQALMPEGSPLYTRSQLDTGNASRLQEMIRNLLADRFQLALHSEMKETSVYLLMRTNGTAKLVAWQEGNPSRGFVGMAGRGEQRSFHIIGGKKSMSDLAIQLQDATRQTVLDRTGITGEFNYDIQYAPAGTQVGAETDSLPGPSLFTVLEEQLGLKLEAARAPVQVLVIDRAARPSEN